MIRNFAQQVLWKSSGKRHHVRSAVVAPEIRRAFFGSVCALVVFCGLIYAAEINALMSKERVMRVDQQKVKEIREEMAQLQTQAIRLTSHENLKEAALSNHFVVAREVSYLAVSDSSVALAK